MFGGECDGACDGARDGHRDVRGVWCEEDGNACDGGSMARRMARGTVVLWCV